MSNAGIAVSTYEFRIDSLRTSVTEAKSLLADLEAAAQRVTSLQQSAASPAAPSSAGASSAAAASQAQAASAQQAADAELRLAQAESRGLVIKGELAGASQRLQQAITAYSNAADSSATSILRLQNAENQLSSVQQKLASEGTGLTATFQGLQSTLGAVGIAFGAQQLVQGTIALAQLGAQAEQVRTAFDRLAAQSNTTGEALLKSLRQASHGEINDLNLQLSANRAQLLGVAHDAQTMGTLLEYARLRGKAMGLDTAQAFDNIVTGVGRASPLILDNLGITLKIGTANAEYAKSLGKSADQLSETEKKQAVLNAVLKQARTELQQAGNAADSNAQKFARFAASLDNLKAGVGTLAANRLGPAADDAAKFVDALNGAGPAFQGIQSGNAVVQSLSSTFGSILGPIASYNSAIISAAGSLFGLGDASQQAAAAQQQEAAATLQQGTAAAAAVPPTLAQAQAMIEAASAGNLLYDSQGQVITVTQESADKSLLDEQAKNLQATQTQILEQQTRLAAESFLALNPNISQSGVASAYAAGQISAAVAQFIEMTLRTAEARAQLAALQAQAGVAAAAGAAAVGAPSYSTGPQANAQWEQFKARGSEYRAALREETLATGTAAEKRKVYNDQLAHMKTLYGENSAEFVKARTDLERFDDQQEKSAKKGGGKGRGKGAGGGGGLSDQQKLDNQLLDQQGKTNDQLENAQLQHEDQSEKLAREHDQKLLQIDSDYNQKRLQAERDANQNALDSRAGFYEGLAGLSGKQGQKLAAELSAQYESAVSKAQQIGREKGADAGEAYLNAAEQAISKEGRLKEQINAALYPEDGGKKDKAKATYLQGVLQLQQNADNARLQLVEQAGSQIANERSRQIADENSRYSQAVNDESAKYADAQDKIVTKSDQAAQRKIANAERSGKAVSAETAAITQQNNALQQNVDLASRSGARPVPTALASAPTVPAVPRAAHGGQVDLAAVVSAIEGLHSKLDAMIGAEGEGTAAARDVAAALRGTLAARITNFPSGYGKALT